MFIRTETTADPEAITFVPDAPVLVDGAAVFTDSQSADRSPLARRLFEIDGVVSVHLDTRTVTVAKAPEQDWDHLRTPVLMAIMAHYGSGEPALRADVGEDDAQSVRIRELLETRIKPALAQTGGEAIFRGFRDGVVYLEMTGRAFAMKDGIENMLRHYVPDITAVRDHRDALPKPGLETPEAKAIETVLRDEVNPSVAGHGGHITLLDVRGGTAYIRLEGGCQGCGMAGVTLKQGVETAIKRVAPNITSVLDVTDHAGGENPYYRAGAGGTSPF